MDIFFNWRWWIIQKNDDVWNDISNSIKRLDSKPIYHKDFLKTKVTLYGDETSDFHDEEMPKVGSSYTLLAVI